MRPPDKHGRREAQADAELLLGQRDAVVVLGDRHIELAAGEEGAFLAADRHHVRLGQHAHQAVLLLGGGAEAVAVRSWWR
jgi:hypothetical protein